MNTLDIVFALEGITGEPITPAATFARWNSADMIILDHKVVPSKGELPDGSELIIAFTAGELATLAATAPRLRIGLYPKDRSDLAPGIVEWNMSFRFTALQILTFNGEEYREEKDFVAAGTTLGKPSAADIRSYLVKLQGLLGYAADSDSQTVTLATRIEQGLLDVPGIGKAYTGSVRP